MDNFERVEQSQEENEILQRTGQKEVSKVALDELANTGKYDLNLINELKLGNFSNIHFYINESNNNDKALMEPLLYAVRNDLGTYAIYKYCGENVQSDPEITRKVIKEEPSLIENTPLSRDKNFILRNASIAPKIIKYADQDIFADSFVVISLCYMNEKVAAEVLQNVDADIAKAIEVEAETSFFERANRSEPLSNDKDFLSLAIKTTGAAILKNASAEIKNDFDFLKEQAAGNASVIEFVVDNIQEFGTEGIKGVRESSKEMTMNDLFSALENDDPEFAIYRNIMDSKGDNNPYIMAQLSCFVSSRAEINPSMFKNTMNYAILTMETAIRNVNEQGEIVADYEISESMVPPHALTGMITKLKAKGHEIDEETIQQYEKYLKDYDNYKEKIDEKKRQDSIDVAKLIQSGASEQEIVEKSSKMFGLANVESALRNSENPNPEYVKTVINCFLYKMDLINSKRDENGIIRNKSEFIDVLSPGLLEGLVKKLENQGITLDPETIQRIEEYKNIYQKDFLDPEKEARKEISKYKPEEKTQLDNSEMSSSEMVSSFNNTLNFALRAMERALENLDENGNMKASDSGIASLMNPMDLEKMIENLEQNSIIITQAQQEQLAEYKKFYFDYSLKFSEKYNSNEKLTMQNVMELITDQRISSVKDAEKGLVENIQESMRTNGEVSQEVNAQEQNNQEDKPKQTDPQQPINPNEEVSDDAR